MLTTLNDFATTHPIFSGRQQQVSPLSEEVSGKVFPRDYTEDHDVFVVEDTIEDK